jgi:hypothetical protein
MKATSLKLIWVLLLTALVNVSFAGGRYADPPMNLMEVYKFAQQALEAAKAGNKDGALEASIQGRKLAVASFKEKSTMPMQVAAGSLKEAITALDAGKVDGAVPPLEHAIGKMNEEIDYYKKEGKL